MGGGAASAVWPGSAGFIGRWQSVQIKLVRISYNRDTYDKFSEMRQEMYFSKEAVNKFCDRLFN